MPEKEQESHETSVESLFALEEHFPDASSLFVALPKPIGEVKDDCVIVLDTNVLLLPYTVTKETLEGIRRTYEPLKSAGRLLIPAHVAREFAADRDKKLRELFQQISQGCSRFGVDEIEIKRYPVLESIPEYQNVLSYVADINKRIKSINKQINQRLAAHMKDMESVRGQIKQWNWNDPISAMYATLFTDQAVVDCSTSKDDLIADFERRKRLKIPPGYKDGGKSENAIGDLIIWHTILQIGEDIKKSLIFVSGDGKPDWWTKSEKTGLCPRFELIDEYYRRSNGHTFYIQDFPEFLHTFGAHAEVVEEVRQAEQSELWALTDEDRPEWVLEDQAPSSLSNDGDWPSMPNFEQAVFDWLKRKYPNIVILRPSRGAMLPFHFVVTDTPRGAIGVFYNYISIEPKPSYVLRWIRERIQHWESFKAISDTPMVMILLVGASPQIARALIQATRGVLEIPPNVNISMGYLEDDGEFRIFYSRET
jgi:hypothetical protein